mmetsp:Transcript_9964/g.25748  ORF Transcript_9964/g.25748 Transcript_9964/m.25748 type:complete len:148 (-) Transcript_9964:26-469(-)
MRRVERLILGSPTLLRTITGIAVHGRKESPVVSDWVTRFAPGLRYGNPTLACEFRLLKAADASSAEPADGADEAADTDAPAATESESATAEESGDAAAASAHAGLEYIELTFTDGSNHVMNLVLYKQSHQVMQRIVDLDVEKGISAG